MYAILNSKHNIGNKEKIIFCCVCLSYIYVRVLLNSLLEKLNWVTLFTKQSFPGGISFGKISLFYVSFSKESGGFLTLFEEKFSYKYVLHILASYIKEKGKNRF